MNIPIDESITEQCMRLTGEPYTPNQLACKIQWLYTYIKVTLEVLDIEFEKIKDSSENTFNRVEYKSYENIQEEILLLFDEILVIK